MSTETIGSARVHPVRMTIRAARSAPTEPSESPITCRYAARVLRFPCESCREQSQRHEFTHQARQGDAGKSGPSIDMRGAEPLIASKMIQAESAASDRTVHQRGQDLQRR